MRDRGDRVARAAKDMLTRPLGRVLVIEDETRSLKPHLEGLGDTVDTWHRRSWGEDEGRPWPSDGPYDAATLRALPSKEAMRMALSAAAAALKPGAPIWVYGANDEGGRSLGAVMEGLFDDPRTVHTKHRSRVFEGTRPQTPPDKARLEDWVIARDGRVGFPGLFAKSGLDPATALLIRACPTPKPQSRVLDFACGLGIIAQALHARAPEAEYTLCDADALAVEAARRNMAGAEVILSDTWTRIQGRFNLIVSNPPIHEGKGESYTVLEQLILGAHAHLKQRGRLVLVTQKRIKVEPLLGRAFKAVERLAEDTRFDVWQASKPKAQPSS
ncbi:methyltransferase [Myxococcota bacterium]|nr:methyltransferase [Myxococcota bacterium]MBU1432106.1 methyltransferase [Myxococcota bacterium]MBU1900685.1 methyltransferase [Myxococcota bacterium]